MCGRQSGRGLVAVQPAFRGRAIFHRMSKIDMSPTSIRRHTIWNCHFLKIKICYYFLNKMVIRRTNVQNFNSFLMKPMNYLCDENHNEKYDSLFRLVIKHFTNNMRRFVEWNKPNPKWSKTLIHRILVFHVNSNVIKMNIGHTRHVPQRSYEEL